MKLRYYFHCHMRYFQGYTCKMNTAFPLFASFAKFNYIFTYRTRFPCVQNRIFCFLLCFFFTQTWGKTCTRQQCTVKEIRCSQEQGSLENYALNGFAFKNISVSSFKKCFEHCARDCRCISFNYVNKAAAGHDLCQLNEENRYLRHNELKQMAGYSYHDIVIDYNVEVSKNDELH